MFPSPRHISRTTRPHLLSALACLLLVGCGSNVAVNVTTNTPVDITIAAAQDSVALGATTVVSASATGGNWLVKGGPAYGSINATGVYQAPSSMPPQSEALIVYSLADATATTSITLIGTAPTPIVQAANLTVTTGGTDQFTVTDGSNALSGGQWAVFGGDSQGTIDATGLYYAPATQPTPNVVTVAYLYASQSYTSVISVINAAPSIVGVVPNVLTQLTSSIQITGTLFDPSSVVKVNGMAAPTTFQDAEHLTAIVSLAAPESTTLQLTVSNHNQGQSSPYQLPTSFPILSVIPAELSGGPVSLTISGSGFKDGDEVLLSGTPLKSTVVSSTQITATGFLTPWSSGSAVVEVVSTSSSPIASLSVPIAATAVTFDAASRFAQQAAMGPRPDVVQHIQQVGFSQFINEQFAMSPVTFGPDAFRDYLENAVSGNSLLRQRVALALESFMVPQNVDWLPSVSYYESMLEQDAGGNFRQLVTDLAESPNLGTLLNLAGNTVATSPLNQPNQNFARELMQLFTIGPVLLNDDGSQQVDASGTPIPAYDQNTVIDLTRALTGWTYGPIVNQTASYWGVDWSQPMIPLDRRHDENAKLLFGTVVMPAGQNTVQDQAQALDAIFNHQNVPPYISRILIQHLVKSNPTPAYIQRISQIFKDDGNGVRGNMQAVVQGILLDPEARLGDITATSSDGFLQEPLLMQTFAMSALQQPGTDDQVLAVPPELGETWWSSPTVFGYYSPYYIIPGTTVHSPEFMLWNNISALQRSEVLWGMVAGQEAGYESQYQANSWLFQNFTTAPQMIDAVNHLLYHGQMPAEQQQAITRYIATTNPFQTQYQLEVAIFLALNGDSYSVVQ